VTAVRRQETYRTCGVCHRTLLLGERAARYTPGNDDWVDVCALCVEAANEHGWVKEGTPTTPLVADGPQRRKRRRGFGALFETALGTEPEPAVPDPVLRRLSPDEQALVEAAELFNESPYRRTITAVAKSLGEARASMLPLSGVNTEIVVTIAWDISWYQYRVVFESSQPVRLIERGHELSELAERFQAWNASLDGQGRLVPSIPRF
jgi:hypothetical protein